MASSTRARKDGMSLAKGPVGLLGLAMLAFGALSLVMGDNSFTSDPTGGDVDGDTWLGVEGNGWTNLLWIAGGGLLAFGSGFHWGAKTMALLVGLALAAAAILAIFDGPTGVEDGDVLGIFAANDLTMLLWGAAAAYLLISALLPRVGGHRPTRDEQLRETRDADRTAPARQDGEHDRTRREPIAHDGERTETRHDRGEHDAGRTEAIAHDGERTEAGAQDGDRGLAEHPERPTSDEPRGDGGRFDRQDAPGDPQVEATRSAERGEQR